MKKTSSCVIKIIMQTAPFVIVALCAIIYFTQLRGITARQLLDYTPENIWLAALMIIGLFALKSLSVFFPMSVLVVASGLIAPNMWVAFLINLIGIFIMMNIPYLIGRYAERELVEKLLSKNKNIDKVRKIHMGNETAFAFFLRIINILPYDIVSVLLGSTGCKWSSYVIGSMLGTIPGMVCCTLSATYADDMTSPQFITSIAVNIVFSVVSGVSYIIYVNRRKKKGLM